MLGMRGLRGAACHERFGAWPGWGSTYVKGSISSKRSLSSDSQRKHLCIPNSQSVPDEDKNYEVEMGHYLSSRAVSVLQEEWNSEV